MYAQQLLCRWPKGPSKVFKSVNVATLLGIADRYLKMAGATSPRLDAEVLLAKCLDLEIIQLYTYPDRMLDGDEEACFSKYLERRIKGEPVAYITGEKEFWSISLKVTRDVLIPRPDTETVVEEVIHIARYDSLKKGNILEIGTGSGAISLALATELPEAGIYAADISERALKVAKENAFSNNLGHKITFFCSNLFSPLESKFDIVVSNPPYIAEEEFLSLPREVRQNEPRAALIAGPQGTEFHEMLIKGALSVLHPGGWLVMEIGDNQKKAVGNLFEESGGYESIRFRLDYSGRQRVAAGRKRRPRGG
ncbi:MAG: peptide chain release factor N(5)-glutamine methyltransferase [Syntrophales bacterium]|jgi:release factor glutamine methyltransferase|nr:peptide chain release factor N(5)-glutamine methyltransferase [Syntrophales bacterium]MDY0043326.1 peptide chain release factor N(5)-glutamine methyltransferase [Syntrophales bacterium]